MSVAPAKYQRASVSDDVVIGHCATNGAININSVDTWSDS